LGSSDGPASLKVVQADMEAFIATQRVNRDHEVDVECFIERVYRPPHEVRVVDRVNDGLNRALRGHRPPRERPPDSDEARYENYWQARSMMDLIGEAVSQVEKNQSGQVNASKMFKRLDFDNDGYITLSDLSSACDKFRVPHSHADLHALFSQLDKEDKGSVEIGEFCRQYEVPTGSLLDKMTAPIRSVYPEGGVDCGGLQEQQELAAAATRSISAPAGPRGEDGGLRSQMSRAGATIANGGSVPVISEPSGQPRGVRVTDVLRDRCAVWKPHKSELFYAAPKTRFGMTVYPDTRHVTEANVPLSHSYMPDHERFKTTNNIHNIYAAPTALTAQSEDTVRKHARGEYRIERIRQRQREFDERAAHSEEASRQFDELKVARKALNQLNYERRCRLSLA